MNMNPELIKKRINEVCTEKGLSKNKLAKVLEVSGATMSNIEHEGWHKLGDELLLKLWHKIKPDAWQVIETANVEHIVNACEYAKLRHKMAGIIGSTGFGKTTALKTYCQGRKNTYFVSCRNSMNAKQVLRAILRVMGIGYEGTIYDMGNRIIDELNKQRKPLLIIDEAGKLSERVLQYLYDIKDDSHTGIVLAGVEYFLKEVEKVVEKHRQGMPEFYGRISYWLTLNTPTRDEMRSICHANGVTDKHEVAEMVKSENFRRLFHKIENDRFDNSPLSGMECRHQGKGHRGSDRAAASQLNRTLTG